MLKLCEYFNIDINVNYLKKNKQSNLYDEYVIDCIEQFKNKNKTYKEISCCKCGRLLPLDIRFFVSDNRNKSGFSNLCKMCKKSYYPIANDDTQARKIYKLLGLKAFLLYKKNIIEFYDMYHSKFDIVLSVDNALKILKNDYELKKITVNDLNIKYIKNNYKVKFIYNLTDKIINEYCSNNDCKLRPYKYPNYILGYVSLEEGKKIFTQYLHDNNIKIENIFDFDYVDILKRSKLTQFLGSFNKSTCNSALNFVVYYNNYEYAGYKYKLRSENYYKLKENRIFDMRWFIEKDMKIEINKIPLYITKYQLSRRCRQLYHLLSKRCKIYNNLFEWINECYPDRFNIHDFDINPYRSQFDSIEEAVLDEFLKENFDNVIYNARNSENTINIKGMIPDWIIMLDHGCYLVEYFGLYSENNISNSDRLMKYMDKIKQKELKYKELEGFGYKHLFIYPKDKDNNFKLLKEKIKYMK